MYIGTYISCLTSWLLLWPDLGVFEGPLNGLSQLLLEFLLPTNVRPQHLQNHQHNTSQLELHTLALQPLPPIVWCTFGTSMVTSLIALGLTSFRAQLISSPPTLTPSHPPPRSSDLFKALCWAVEEAQASAQHRGRRRRKDEAQYQYNRRRGRQTDTFQANSVQVCTNIPMRSISYPRECKQAHQ